MMSRLKVAYEKEIIEKLISKLSVKNKNEVRKKQSLKNLKFTR